MKKILIFIAFSFLLLQNINAQQYPLFTNYITNRIGFNPAIAGQSECVNALATHRQQWVGVNENPKTSIISAYGKIKKLPLGVGGYMFSDNAGALKRTGVSGILSYAMHLDSSTFLGIGIASGYYALQLGENSRVSDPTDPAYINGKAGKNFPDFNAGVFFQRKSLWIGFSTPQIVERKINFAPNSTNELKRHYFLMAGYDMPINKNMSIEPSGMLRYVENAELSYDLSLKATFNKAFWLAGSFRKGDALAAMVGLTAKRGINVYYAYDYTTSGLSAKSRGSHEFGIGMTLCKKKDRDGDGVMDDEDKCPDVPGPKENKGCPEEDKEKKDELDTDKDGVPDKDDQCPNVPGPKENKGCPFADRDNDGIRDDIDKCPDIAGTLENMGCPLRDRDRDGIIDEKDPCPDEYGELSNYGCPPGKLPADFDPRKFMEGDLPTSADARGKRFGPNSDIDGDGIPNDKDPDIDGDGIPNDQDPDMDGDGIPNDDDPDMDGDGIPNDLDPDMDGDGVPNDRDLDTDGDGVPNSKDPCPRTRGKNGKGCPELAREAVNAIDFAVRNIYYDSDKAEIQPSSYDYLNRVAAWMVQHPEYQLDMQGHADSRNSSEYNMVLSKNRVNAVKSYMIQQGVSATSIKVEWFGETRPVASGNNEAAWKKNRRTEMQWRFE
jgi:type IX secretion system PorP/SprF family membrane protein